MALETQRQRRPPRPGEPTPAAGMVGALGPGSPGLQKYLNDCRSFYSCIYCRTHLADHDELVSRSFQGNRSRAYLFNSVVNISCGAPVQRELNTGSHAVADIFCTNCATIIGWKYEKAYEDSQKYKEGKFIIELVHVVRENRHLELDKRDTFKSLLAQQAGPAVIEQVATTSPFGLQYHNRRPRHLHPHNHYQDLLSPPRPYSWSSSSSSLSRSAQQGGGSGGGGGGGGGSTASSASSSSSSASASSPSSPNNPRTRDARVRYNSSGQYEDEHDRDDQDEPEHEEALMFPFYDDLYGNRSSYSNLSTSLSYFQRRMRHSLQMASMPLQSPPHRSPPPQPPRLGCDREEQAHRSPDTCTADGASSGSTGIPSTSAGGGCALALATVAAAAAAAAADQSDNDDRHAMSGETQFELEHEHGPAPSSSDNCDPSQGDDSKSECEPTTTTTSSQDDEEFYDCCTEHDVA